MFKKLQDQFSKDLLDAVSGVLKNSPEQIEEKKAVNKHGHDVPGEEDADVNNDGKVDTTDSYLKNRRKAIAKNMSMKKEEVEELDELSKDTMKSYLDKKKAPSGTVVANVNDKDSMRKYTNRVVGGVRAAKRLMAKEEAEQIDEILDTPEKVADYKAKAEKSFKKNIWKGGEKAHRTTTKRLYGLSHPKVANEEAEVVAEAPVDGVAAGSMEGDKHLCATKVFHKEWAEGTPIFSQHAEPDFLGNIAWYDVMFEHGIERQVPTADMEILMAESHMMHKKKVKEEVELDEARGRPKKAAAKDYTIHPVTKEKLMHNNPEHMKKIEALQRSGKLEKPKVEASQHIMNQLQKAKTSMQGGSVIHFTHGESQHVSGTHAAKLLDKYAGMKPADKEAFQKKISHSHEKLKSEL